MKYVRLTLTDGKSIFLRITREGKVFLRGYQVNREGDDFKVGKADRTIRIVSYDAISKRVDMEMSLKYGWLVPLGDARKGL